MIFKTFFTFLQAENDCNDGKRSNTIKCAHKQRTAAATASSCEVKLEQSDSPSATESTDNKPLRAQQHSVKLENNNGKCESCSVDSGRHSSSVTADDMEHDDVVASNTVDADDDNDDAQQQQRPSPCRVKSEQGYKCEILKCEQCAKEAGHLANMEIDKDSGILDDDAGSGKLETDTDVKDELLTTLVSIRYVHLKPVLF